MALVKIADRLAVREKPEEVPFAYQEWRDLLFLHWKYDFNELQKLLPPGLFVDTYHKDAYITVAPFRMQNVRISGFPAMPGMSNFLELNVRTYVYNEEGVPGVWFISLDLNSSFGVSAARKMFSLPYVYADQKMTQTGNLIQFLSQRTQDKHITEFMFTPEGNSGLIEDPGSLDFFLLERYLFYTSVGNDLKSCRVYHKPYPVSKVLVSKFDNHIFKIDDLQEPPQKTPDFAHYSPGVDVDVFNLKDI